jgi:hypothetical protein
MLTSAGHILPLSTGCFKKELYNGIPNVTVWRVLRKSLQLKVWEVSMGGSHKGVQTTHLSTITIQVKLGMVFYIMTVQNNVMSS